MVSKNQLYLEMQGIEKENVKIHDQQRKNASSTIFSNFHVAGKRMNSTMLNYLTGWQ